ncbi:hypothetical protein RJ640_015780 [Escallonia rubra]|uniref:ATP synthase subunit O, mitochondrial n=1 Tax=Escallonia rubra TaxID=112253 RepID=A0AA88S2J2_9ASTE|nr:hypothetical protein RJ640_015780 [Escallonia rubra]
MVLAGRIRSGLPLLLKSLKSDSHRSTVHRALLCPSFSNSESSRNFSSASPPKEQKVKVPLALYGGPGNYASALYIAAVKANTLDKVESELVDLVEASKRTDTFSQFMKDLSVPADTRVKAINEICAHAKFSDVTKQFLGYSATILELPDMADMEALNGFMGGLEPWAAQEFQCRGVEDPASALVVAEKVVDFKEEERPKSPR